MLVSLGTESRRDVLRRLRPADFFLYLFPLAFGLFLLQAEQFLDEVERGSLCFALLEFADLRGGGPMVACDAMLMIVMGSLDSKL